MARTSTSCISTKGKTPPADAFWSITMYDKEGFQIPNPIERFAIGSHDDLKYDAEGSLDIYLQAESPGKEQESNWLPAPRSEFQPTMRLYSLRMVQVIFPPRPEVLDKRWAPPPITRVL